MQQYISEPNPTNDGKFVVSRWNLLTEQYEPLPGEIFRLEDDAKNRARDLNEEYQGEIKHFGK